MEEVVFKGRTRQRTGSREVKRLRAEGLLPANVYGHNEPNRNVSISRKDFERFFDDGHRMLTLDVDGVQETVVVKEVQYDNLGSQILHADFARVDRQERIVMQVPIETVGMAKGLNEGGSLDLILKEVQVEGPAMSIPEKIEVKVADLEINDAIHIRDLPAPPRCRFEHEDEEVVVMVSPPRVVEEDLEPAAEGEMPEVISEEEDEGEKSEGDAEAGES